MKINKGQVTIFIIVGVAIIAAFVLLMVLRNSTRGVDIGGREFEVSSFMSACLRENAEEVADELISHGGVLNARDSRVYNGTNVTYLCNNINYYEGCINQYPAYLSYIEAQLESKIGLRARSCVDALDEEMKARGYSFNRSGESQVNVDFFPGLIEVELLNKMSVNSGGSSRAYELFKSRTSSPLYGLANTANEIVSQEARFCYFEYVGYSLLYPEFQVSATSLSDSTKIYTITHKNSGKEMKIAVRGCAIPAGY